MKVKKTDIEIKLNNQIPKLNNELNKYHKNISLKFKGKVFLVDDNLNKIKELKNDDKIKKNGYYILKFIDEDNNIMHNTVSCLYFNNWYIFKIFWKNIRRVKNRNCRTSFCLRKYGQKNC